MAVTTTLARTAVITTVNSSSLSNSVDGAVVLIDNPSTSTVITAMSGPAGPAVDLGPVNAAIAQKASRDDLDLISVNLAAGLLNLQAAFVQRLGYKDVEEAVQPKDLWATITSDYAAKPGDYLSIDTSAKALNLSLPTNGGTVFIRDHAGTWSLHPVYVNGTNRTIAGLSVWNADVSNYLVTFNASDGVWLYTLDYNYRV